MPTLLLVRQLMPDDERLLPVDAILAKDMLQDFMHVYTVFILDATLTDIFINMQREMSIFLPWT